jgi:GxxExxY protein
MTENELSGRIIGLAIEVHNSLGPGLLESAYKECMFYKIAKSQLWVEKEKPHAVNFRRSEIGLWLPWTCLWKGNWF